MMTITLEMKMVAAGRVGIKTGKRKTGLYHPFWLVLEATLKFWDSMLGKGNLFKIHIELDSYC